MLSMRREVQAEVELRVCVGDGRSGNSVTNSHCAPHSVWSPKLLGFFVCVVAQKRPQSCGFGVCIVGVRFRDVDSLAWPLLLTQIRSSTQNKMKICSRCSQQMLDVASRCVHCGYEIKDEGRDTFPRKQSLLTYREGIAYSSFAQLSLEVWAFLAILGIVIALVVTLFSLFQGEWLRVLFSLLSAWGNFALYALLRRVADN